MAKTDMFYAIADLCGAASAFLGDLLAMLKEEGR